MRQLLNVLSFYVIHLLTVIWGEVMGRLAKIKEALLGTDLERAANKAAKAGDYQLAVGLANQQVFQEIAARTQKALAADGNKISHGVYAWIKLPSAIARSNEDSPVFRLYAKQLPRLLAPIRQQCEQQGVAVVCELTARHLEGCTATGYEGVNGSIAVCFVDKTKRIGTRGAFGNHYHNAFPA